jgi:hypothetical protein
MLDNAIEADPKNFDVYDSKLELAEDDEEIAA